MKWLVHDETNQNGNSLTHYGVKGMKWGVRKEYEAKGRKSKSKVLNAVELKRKTENGDSVVHIDDKNNREKRKQALDFVYNSGATPGEYAPESVALYNFNNLPKYNMRLNPSQQAMATNHNAPTYERSVNCFECTMAYEMRRRGYNVQANTVPGGFAMEVLHAFDIKDSFNVTVSNPEGKTLSNKTLAEECYRQLEDQCLKYGDGARGMIAMYYAEPYDGGHAMTWVVENGKFKLIDNQSDIQDPKTTFLMCNSEIDVYRLDNAEVLPGVSDFVEPFKATVKEENAAKKKYNKQKKVWKKEGYVDDYKQKGKKTFDKIIKNIGKNVGEFVSKGKEAVSNFLKNPLSIQTKTKSESNVTWEVK